MPSESETYVSQIFRYLPDWANFTSSGRGEGVIPLTPESNIEVSTHTLLFWNNLTLKFMVSRKTTKIDEIFTFDLTLCTKCQIDGEDFVNFCGLLRKYEL